MTNQVADRPSPDEIVSLGEKIYFQNKEDLEKDHLGEYVVIEVKSQTVFIDPDKLTAINKAQKVYPNELFYITQIGNLKQSSNKIDEMCRYDWAF